MTREQDQNILRNRGLATLYSATKPELPIIVSFRLTDGSRTYIDPVWSILFDTTNPANKKYVITHGPTHGPWDQEIIPLRRVVQLELRDPLG